MGDSDLESDTGSKMEGLKRGSKKSVNKTVSIGRLKRARKKGTSQAGSTSSSTFSASFKKKVKTNNISLAKNLAKTKGQYQHLFDEYIKLNINHAQQAIELEAAQNYYQGIIHSIRLDVDEAVERLINITEKVTEAEMWKINSAPLLPPGDLPRPVKESDLQSVKHDDEEDRPTETRADFYVRASTEDPMEGLSRQPDRGGLHMKPPYMYYNDPASSSDDNSVSSSDDDSASSSDDDVADNYAANKTLLVVQDMDETAAQMNPILANVVVRNKQEELIPTPTKPQPRTMTISNDDSPPKEPPCTPVVATATVVNASSSPSTPSLPCYSRGLFVGKTTLRSLEGKENSSLESNRKLVISCDRLSVTQAFQPSAAAKESVTWTPPTIAEGFLKPAVTPFTTASHVENATQSAAELPRVSVALDRLPVSKSADLYPRQDKNNNASKKDERKKCHADPDGATPQRLPKDRLAFVTRHKIKPLKKPLSATLCHPKRTRSALGTTAPHNYKEPLLNTKMRRVEVEGGVAIVDTKLRNVDATGEPLVTSYCSTSC